MRRLASSLIVACGIALLTACSGGGYGLNSNTGNSTKVPDEIIFENGSASVDDFFLSPTGNAPILVSAVAIKGLGSGSSVIPDATFSWAAVYAPAGTTYLKGASPNGQGTCGAPPAPPFPINSLLQQGPVVGGAPYPLYGGAFTQLLAQPPPAGNVIGTYPNYTGIAQTIFVGPPLVPAATSPFAATTTVQQPTPATTGNYCIRLQATHTSSGVIGTTLVVVSQAP